MYSAWTKPIKSLCMNANLDWGCFSRFRSGEAESESKYEAFNSRAVTCTNNFFFKNKKILNIFFFLHTWHHVGWMPHILPVIWTQFFSFLYLSLIWAINFYGFRKILKYFGYFSYNSILRKRISEHRKY